MDIIIVEDNKERQNIISSILSEFLFKYNIDFDIIPFHKYNNDLIKKMKEVEPKIYILDIQLPGESGIDIARYIREAYDDWSSIIIFISANQHQIEAITHRLMVLTYISKFDDFNNKLKQAIDTSIKILSNKEFLKIKANGAERVIDYKEILYIEKIKYSKYCHIATINNNYEIKENIESLEKRTKFYRIKKHLLINELNVQEISDSIVFKDGSSIKID